MNRQPNYNFKTRSSQLEERKIQAKNTTPLQPIKRVPKPIPAHLEEAKEIPSSFQPLVITRKVQSGKTNKPQASADSLQQEYLKLKQRTQENQNVSSS